MSRNHSRVGMARMSYPPTICSYVSRSHGFSSSYTFFFILN